MPLSKALKAEYNKSYYRGRLGILNNSKIPKTDAPQSTRTPLLTRSKGLVPTPLVSSQLDADGNIIPEYW